MNIKLKTARLSIISNILLITMKLTIGLISGAVSIISEAIHSGMDLIAAIIVFFSVKISGTPPDREHPYGHGKYENVSGVVEAILIFIAAAFIILEAIKKIADHTKVEQLGIGSLVMLISAIVNFIVSHRLYKVAKLTDSIAIEADALHLKTDIYTSIGVAGGLLLIWITKYYILDPIVAIGVALLILKESYLLLKNAFAPLIDSSLSETEIMIIRNVIESKGMSYHDLKTRKSGQYRFADLHLEMSPNSKLNQVHAVCDEIENEVKLKINNIELSIHVEPLIK
jgi:cation diffusion facilitator family transporter